MNSTSTTGCAVTNGSQAEPSGALPGGWHPFKVLGEHLQLAPAGTMASPRPRAPLPKLLPTTCLQRQGRLPRQSLPVRSGGNQKAFGISMSLKTLGLAELGRGWIQVESWGKAGDATGCFGH